MFINKQTNLEINKMIPSKDKIKTKCKDGAGIREANSLLKLKTEVEKMKNPRLKLVGLDEQVMFNEIVWLRQT